METKLSKGELIQAPRGTKDILPDEAVKWRAVEQAVHEVGRLFGYGEIRTPSFENLRLFKRAVGEETDIVSKEMYLLQPRGDEKRNFALRPELTAPVVRAAIEHGMLTGQSDCVRLYYCSAPNFRYEKPQLGRLRQHHQFGTELLGPASPLADAETIFFAMTVLHKLGIAVENYYVRLNSLGSKESRGVWKSALVPYLRENIDNLSKDSQRRTETNPLRVLDSKAPEDQEVIRNAPKIQEYLTISDKTHFDRLCDVVKFLNKRVLIDPLLVRGIDYYSGTVFEFTSTSNEMGVQNSLCGGGRYDYLVEQLGGPITPAVGFGSGIERLLLANMDLNFNSDQEQYRLKVYIVAQSDEGRAEALTAATYLRRDGIPAIQDLNERSVKAQMREANRLEARFVYFINEDGIGENQLKDMKTSQQADVLLNDLVNNIKEKCRTDPSIRHSSFIIHHS